MPDRIEDSMRMESGSRVTQVVQRVVDDQVSPLLYVRAR